MLATGCPGLLVGGRRRMGKSTLIANLIGFIPDTVKVVPISMLAGAPRSAVARPAVDLLTEADQALAAAKALLLAIDEFEKIDKIGEGVFPIDLLATVRKLIQSHRRIIWAFVGSYDLTELTHAAWSSYSSAYGASECCRLRWARRGSCSPSRWRSQDYGRRPARRRPRFDPGFWGDGGIERIHTEAGGWPHLVQLLAETAVELANDRQLATLDEGVLEEAADQAVGRGTVVLSELIEGEFERRPNGSISSASAPPRPNRRQRMSRSAARYAGASWCSTKGPSGGG